MLLLLIQQMCHRLQYQQGNIISILSKIHLYKVHDPGSRKFGLILTSDSLMVTQTNLGQVHVPTPATHRVFAFLIHSIDTALKT